MRNKKAIGDGNVPGHVLKMLKEDGFRLMIQLMNNIYENMESGPITSLKLQ